MLDETVIVSMHHLILLKFANFMYRIDILQNALNNFHSQIKKEINISTIQYPGLIGTVNIIHHHLLSESIQHMTDTNTTTYK